MTENCPATSNRFRWSTLLNLFVCWLVLGVGLAGCGSGEVRGRVVGNVTFQGKAVTEGIVTFSNDDKGVHMTTKLRPDGSYEIMTAKGAGLTLGTYRISVSPPPPELAPMGSTAPPAMKPYPNIPKKYRDAGTSGLTLTVKQGENRFDIAMAP
jgi:hypothetical protein